MPVIKSVKKALRQSERRREGNNKRKKDLKNIIKRYKKLAEEGNLEEGSKKLNLVYKKLDKAAKVNLIKKNKASRLKSRLSRKLKNKAF